MTLVLKYLHGITADQFAWSLTEATASKIPDFLKPFTMIEGFSSMECQTDVNQLVHCALTAGADKSTLNGHFFLQLTSHDWKCAFIPSFTGLLMETSIGCNLSVQFGGTIIEMMLCFFSTSSIAPVVCPLKQSNITRAD